MNEILFSSQLEGTRLISTVNVPKDLRKYFRSFKLVVNYNAPVKADMSILNIPLVSTVLPLAWLTGVNVRVERLDKNYVEAISVIKHKFNLMLARGRFTSRLIVDDLVENKTQSEGTALLFSGGVDSSYSLIRNVGLKPRLLMFFGVVGYQLDLSYRLYNQLVRRTYCDFARREGLDISFVDTNVVGLLNRSRITHDFYRILRGMDLWRGLEIPLVLLSLPAPLSITRFNRVLIAASVDPTHNFDKYPYSSQPKIDEKFAWADLSVKHDGYIHRFSKTNLIKAYLKKHVYSLRVCNDPPSNRLNCSSCEKCYRTIAPLILNGVDPNTCGFEVNKSTFEHMRYVLENEKRNALRVDLFWKELQTLIPVEMKKNPFESRSFFMWLKNLNFDSVQKKKSLQKDIFYLLPYPLAVIFKAIFRLGLDQPSIGSLRTVLTSYFGKRKKS